MNIFNGGNSLTIIPKNEAYYFSGHRDDPGAQ